MKQVIYCKYNSNRNPRFQTRTMIVQEGQKKYVEKWALDSHGQDHVASLIDKYNNSKSLYPDISLVQVYDKGDHVEFPYIMGQPFEELVTEGSFDVDSMISSVKNVIAKYITPSEKFIREFSYTDGFREYFGEVDGVETVKGVAVSPCNIDMILENLIIVDGVPTIIDYEWVMDFPIPHNYVIFRLLSRSYSKYFDMISAKYSIEEYMEQFGISVMDQNVFRQMEDNFIRRVYGGGSAAFDESAFGTERARIEDYSFYKNGYNQTLDILHDTEKKFLDYYGKYNELNKLYVSKEKEVKVLRQQIRESEDYTEGLVNLYNSLISSSSWKITKPMRSIVGKLHGNSDSGPMPIEYEKSSVEVNDVASDKISVKEYIDSQKSTYEGVVKSEHLISIITPLFNTPKKYLIDMIESMIGQTFDNWELCLVDFSEDGYEYIDEICKDYASKDKRIKYSGHSDNIGIPENSNLCASKASGDYIGILDHDDILHKDAIKDVIYEIENNGADFVYTDEAKFRETIDDAFYVNVKPDFTHVELCVHNYICHFNVFSKNLFENVGGYRADYNGSQDHDLVLRLTEEAKHIVHIPRTLYYWRVHENSVAQNIEAKPYATRSGEKAVTDAFKRMGENYWAESVINNIPLYRIKSDNTEDIDISVLTWNAENNNIFDELKGIDSRYILLLHEGIEVDMDALKREISYYKNNNNIVSFDSKILYNDRILSGGTYLGTEEEMPIMIRCMGGAADFSGYEANMLHTRPVACSLGLCTVIDKNVLRDAYYTPSNKGIIKDVIEYTNNLRKQGMLNLWIPYYEVKSIDESIERELIDSLNNVDMEHSKDPYFNSIVKSIALT